MDIQSETAKVLRAALDEDAARGDVTSEAMIAEDLTGIFTINARQEIIFCGAETISHAFGAMAKILVNDGDYLQAGGVIAEINGNLRQILLWERSVLNLVQFLSAIATETSRYVQAVDGAKAKILDTRKTVPGLRALSKYAVRCGGGQNHRMDLHDMIMVKDNHITAAGGITAAVAKAHKYMYTHAIAEKEAAGMMVEVECDNLEQVKEALAAGADIILADNMDPEQLQQVVQLAEGKALVEASGNVNLQTIGAIAATGVDYISTSKITMAATPVDIGLDEV